MGLKENIQEIADRAVNGTTNTYDGSKEILIKDAIFIRDKGCLTKIAYADIIYLKGDGNYTTLVTKEKSFSLRNILKEFEEILPTDLFLRIHKSFIVNLEEIRTISPKEVSVRNEKVPVGRTYYPTLISGVQKLGSNGFD
ncbi:LytR/AlgR family response regulator transcription factor [Cyclobacterium jeungdonense]|uniref:LytTR family DNA-binding domain-containing protein n=1 Tax=Cyclobacterium jeungdonense TaxID=708087 RepID=A0ABT8CAC2_9BACT|nr:LytTR family DNA-binding domain-containing protein [Cyclobacterium jeungdonense]MDN3688621.1 LytTR family DNA-binding domain-containing protein [Cyclobacterium jeungdonense]